MKYRSRVSIVVLVIILGVFGFPLIGNDIKNIAAISMVSIPFIFAILIIVTINYTILDNSIVVRCCGFKSSTIDIMKIKTIKRSYNPLSSPAASLKRLEIKFYRKGRIKTALISPMREAEFLEKLKEINPNIEIEVVEKQKFLHVWDWDI